MGDRTKEFLEYVEHFSSGHGQVPDTKKINRKKEINEQRSAFNEVAAEIGRGIHRTSGMLAKLANLVKRQGLFDDPTDEINSLIYRIKQDLDDLNSKADSAQQYIDSTKRLISSSKNQSSEHSMKVVSHLKSDLMNFSKDFKNVLELRASKMKDQQDRKVALIGKGVLSPMRQMETSLSANNSKRQANDRGSSSAPVVTKPKFQSPYAEYDFQYSQDNKYAQPDGMQQQQQQELLLAPVVETQYYDAREKAVGEVEKTIGELGQLFKRLATMISEQEELVERIDDDIEAATANAENARNSLMKTYEKVSSNRGLFMKLFAILGVFAVFFILFLL